MRLNAYLARAGVASRRKADELIKAGRVTRQRRAGRAEHVRRGRRPGRGRRPAGGQAAARLPPAAQARRCRDDGARPGRPARPSSSSSRTSPASSRSGRLDADTTGALLLTNDGELAHRLAHPRYEVDKVYVADVEGEPTDEALPGAGRRASSSRTAARRRRRRAGSARREIELTLHEGRKHQVKRMCEAVGHPVRRLHRRAYAGLDARRPRGPVQWRELTRDEVEALAGRYSNQHQRSEDDVEADEREALVHRGLAVAGDRPDGDGHERERAGEHGIDDERQPRLEEQSESRTRVG